MIYDKIRIIIRKSTLHSRRLDTYSLVFIFYCYLNQKFMRAMGKYIRALRAPFFTASLVSIVLGTAISWENTGNLDVVLLGLTLLAGLSLHAGTNLVNDYFDHKSGCDESNLEFVSPFTGGSRVIQNHILSAKSILTFGLVCFVISSLIGLYLAIKVGWPIFLFGVIGLFSGFFYTAPPIFLVSKGIGEILVGLNFGILMTQGAYFVQTQAFSLEALLASVPVALLIMAVLYINEFPDYTADKQTGKNHLVVRWGREKAVRGYIFLMLLSYPTVAIGVFIKSLPIWTLLAFLTFPLTFKAIKTAQIYFNQPHQLVAANANTIKVHLASGLLLSLGYIISKLI